MVTYRSYKGSKPPMPALTSSADYRQLRIVLIKVQNLMSVSDDFLVSQLRIVLIKVQN